MKFSSYLVQLKHRENSLSGCLLIDDNPVTATFKKIDNDLFIAQFKNQIEFTFLQNISFKNKDKEVVVLLPVISKYNKRKLTKLSKLLSDTEHRERFYLLEALVSIDKFVRGAELLHFFSIQWNEALLYFLKKELKQEIKLIELTSLSITSYENYINYQQQLNSIFTECYTSRNKSLKFSQIEASIKLPQSSLFFKYLVNSFTNTFSFIIRGDKIIFQKVSLTENEQESLGEISTILKAKKLSIFTIENLLNHSDTLIHKEVNDTLWFLVEQGKVVRLTERYFIFQDDLDKIINKLKKYKRNQGEMIDIKSFRELTLFSRKYIISLFEYFDAHQITERVENKRRILLGA